MGATDELAADGSAALEDEPYRRLGRKVEQQAAVAELGRRALAGREQAALLADAVELTRSALGTELVSILQLDEEAQALTCRANVGWEPSMISPVPLGAASQIAHTFRSREPLVIRDLAAETAFGDTRHLLAFGLVSSVSVAITGAERPFGVLAAHSRQRLSFSDDDVLFLRGIANVVAAAVQRSEADAARARSEARLAFLADASHALARSLDVAETLDGLASLVVPGLADWCVIHLVEDGRLEARVVRHSDPELEARGREEAAEPLDMDMAPGPPEVVRTGEPLLIPEVTDEMIDASTDDETLRRQLHEVGMRSVITVPLEARGAILGVVSLVSTARDRRYGPDDLSLAQELARRAALAVANARLHDAAGVARDRAERLQRVTARLAAAQTPEQVSEVVLSEGLGATGAPAGAIVLLDEEARQLAIADWRGYRNGAMDGWERFDVAAELPASVAVRTGEGVFCQTLAERDERFPALAAVAGPSHAVVTLPLLAGDRALGAISLSFAGERRFDSEERGFLQAIANQCGQALDRVQLQARHALQRDLLEAVLEQMPSGVVIAEAGSGRVLLANRQVAAIAGEPLAASLVEGEHWPLARALRDGTVTEDEDLLFHRADGTRGIVRVSAAPILGGDGTAAAAVAVFHDVTEEVEARLEAERRADASRALEFVADGVLLVDRAGIVRLWNDSAARITGLRSAAVVGRRVVEAIPGWAALEARIPETAAGAEPERAPTLPLEVGGRELWLSISAVAFSEGVVFAFRDATEEHALEQMKSDFVATVSHELRTPLAAVYGAAATLQSRPALDAAERARLLAMISEQAERLSRIVDDILTASRLDARALELELEAVDPVALAREVVTVAERSAPPGFALELHAADGVPAVAADPDRLRQALGNLVENAVKYSGGSLWAEVVVEAADGRVRLTVRDRGLGIPAADRARVFEKFYRVDAGMSGGVSGTGLGLYIVRRLVERMGGRVRVESELGHGSEFAIELPAARA